MLGGGDLAALVAAGRIHLAARPMNLDTLQQSRLTIAVRAALYGIMGLAK
jgi:hypothetical protein